MDLEDVIRFKIYNYPSNYQDRLSVLHHLYCVSEGRWKDGRLDLDLQPRRAEDVYWDEEAELKNWGFPSCQMIVASVKTMVRMENAKRKVVRENAELFALTEKPLNIIFPLSMNSALASVPDDAKSDYLQGALAAIRMVFSTPPQAPSYLPSRWDRNVTFADSILQDLAKRFDLGSHPKSYAEYLQKLQSIREQFST